MFKKSDKALIYFRNAMWISFGIIGALFLILSLITFSKNDYHNDYTAQGISYLLYAILIPLFGVFSVNFTISVAADIKYIRNKLYNNSNEPISQLFSDNENSETGNKDFSNSVNSTINALDTLKKLKNSYERGEITEEAYQTAKKKILDNL